MKKFDAANIYLEVLDAFHKAWVEEHIFPLAIKTLINPSGRPIKIHLQLPESPQQAKIQEKAHDEQPFKMSPLDTLHSLETFVITEENGLLLDILKNQLLKGGGQLYNPIYIYGEKHCGKTHLLMALAQELLRLGKNAFFVHSETFMFHFVDALRKEKMEIFRESYRRVEVLLVDDVHLLRNKWATQEEFFHTFNALHAKGVQLVFSGNAPAPKFKEIEERLISRFEWGVSFKLSSLSPFQYPLLIKKILPFMDLSLSEEAIVWLSESCSSSFELNEALHLLSLKAPSEIEDLESMKRVLSSIFEKNQKNTLTLEAIVGEVAKYFKIKEEDFKRSNKERRFSLPRQIAFFLARKLLKLSFQEIGSYFTRDHSTVIFNVRSIERELSQQNEEISSALADIERILYRT